MPLSRSHLVLWCLSLASSCAAGSPGGPADTNSAGGCQNDLAYTSPPGVDGSLATLDLCLPGGASVPPLVVLVHGGSWVSGDKANFRNAAPDFRTWWHARGFATAAVNFRLASPLGQPLTVGPMDQARDLAHALAWLAAEADALGVSSSAPVLVGYSSGAHLVALLGADPSYLAEAGRPAGSVRATVSLDVHAYDVPFALSLMEGSVVASNIPLIEHLFGTTEEAQLRASPIAHAAGAVAPALLVSVEPDPAEPGTHGHIVNEAAQRYAAALQAAGNVAETFHDSAESHASLAIGFGAPGDPTTEVVGAFLDALDEAVR